MNKDSTFEFEIVVRTAFDGTHTRVPDEHGFIGRFTAADGIQLRVMTPPNCLGLVLEGSTVRLRRNITNFPEKHASYRQDVKVHAPRSDANRPGYDEPHTEWGQNMLTVLEPLPEPGRFRLHTASVASDRGEFFYIAYSNAHQAYIQDGIVIPSLRWKWPADLLDRLFGAARDHLRPATEYTEREVERPANLANNEAIVSWYHDSRGMGVLLGAHGKDYVVYRESLAHVPRGQLRTLKRGQIVTMKHTVKLPGPRGTFTGEAQGVRVKNAPTHSGVRTGSI